MASAITFQPIEILFIFLPNKAETEKEANVACGGDAATQLMVLAFFT